MNSFANYKNGKVTINSYRFPDAQVTDIDDILNAAKKESDEVLVASINTDDELNKIEALVND